jgi:hypothetical protein
VSRHEDRHDCIPVLEHLSPAAFHDFVSRHSVHRASIESPTRGSYGAKHHAKLVVILIKCVDDYYLLFFDTSIRQRHPDLDLLCLSFRTLTDDPKDIFGHFFRIASPDEPKKLLSLKSRSKNNLADVARLANVPEICASRAARTWSRPTWTICRRLWVGKRDVMQSFGGSGSIWREAINNGTIERSQKI